MIDADEFISTFRELGGQGAADKLKLNVRTVFTRRARLEAQLGIKIDAPTTRRAPPKEPEPQQVIDNGKPRVRIQANGAALDVLAIGDMHDAPHIPKDRFYWCGKLAADLGCQYIVPIGDMATFDSVSRHITPGSLAAKTQNPWMDDAASLQDALRELDRGLGSHNAKRHLVMGNHERRLWLYEESSPQIAGVITGEYLSILDDHKFTSTPYGEYFFLGGVGFIHCAINRLGKSYGGKNAEATIGNDALFDHVIGHSHVKREHRAAKLGPSKHVTILNLGCGLPWGHVEDYIYHGAVTGWWWGVHHIRIQNGQITDVNAISMLELQRRYS